VNPDSLLACGAVDKLVQIVRDKFIAASAQSHKIRSEYIISVKSEDTRAPNEFYAVRPVEQNVTVLKPVTLEITFRQITVL